MTTQEKAILNRTALLVGDAAMERIAEARVIVFGVGGVGSWCAESLVRSGIRHLTIVDSDRVCITNVNRQAMATTSTVGRVKVDALRERLLDINPHADINAIQVGMRVRHAKFGEGKVLTVEGSGTERKATIFFDNVGQKTMMLVFAKLTILE